MWNWIITLPLVIGLIVYSIKVIFMDLYTTESDFGLGYGVGILLLILVLSLYSLAAFIPNLSITIRRFHDVGLSGWWYVAGQISAIILSSLIELYDYPFVSGLIILVILAGISIANFVVLVLPTDKMRRMK